MSKRKIEGKPIKSSLIITKHTPNTHVTEENVENEPFYSNKMMRMTESNNGFRSQNSGEQDVSLCTSSSNELSNSMSSFSEISKQINLLYILDLINYARRTMARLRAV
jgi:hypothetical protein